MFMLCHGGRKIWSSMGLLTVVLGCSGAGEDAPPIEVLGGITQALTVTRTTPQTRLERCSQDPHGDGGAGRDGRVRGRRHLLS